MTPLTRLRQPHEAPAGPVASAGRGRETEIEEGPSMSAGPGRAASSPLLLVAQFDRLAQRAQRASAFRFAEREAARRDCNGRLHSSAGAARASGPSSNRRRCVLVSVGRARPGSRSGRGSGDRGGEGRTRRNRSSNEMSRVSGLDREAAMRRREMPRLNCAGDSGSRFRAAHCRWRSLRESLRGNGSARPSLEETVLPYHSMKGAPIFEDPIAIRGRRPGRPGYSSPRSAGKISLCRCRCPPSRRSALLVMMGKVRRRAVARETESSIARA